MLNNLHLVALIKERNQLTLKRLPMVAELQAELAVTWGEQLEQFLRGAQEIAFEPGYTPEAHERFCVDNFVLPGELAAHNSGSIRNLDPIDMQDASLVFIKAILGFARTDTGRELVMFQGFSKSHVIEPGRFLFFTNDNFVTSDRPALTLDSHLAAVYEPAEQKLLFQNFRVTNAILNLVQYYEEASEEEIREILAHEKLAPVSADALAKSASQWSSKRFAMLRDSKILDNYTVEQIVQHANGYDLDIQIDRANGQERIVFPEAKASVKKLLQFLNEELFRGAITDRLFETNSKRIAD